MDESEEVSILEVAEAIANALQLKQGIILDATKSDGRLRMTASNRKLRQYLPDFVFSSFRETLVHSVEWFIENYKTARK